MEAPIERVWKPPLGLDEASLAKTISDYAPLLRLNATEKHLPAQPEDFRRISRFRYSKPGRDAGWNKETRAWETGDRHGPEFHDVPWSDILPESAELLSAASQPDIPPEINIRPRDDANAFGKGSQTGLFLQRGRNRDDASSGKPPAEGGLIRAPVFVDVVHIPEKKVVKLLYWFFYELNHWRFMITHEGDWEHVTLIFDQDRFLDHGPPEAVFFAQHDGGHPLAFEQLQIVEQTHCVIYVHKDGHPCHAKVKDPENYNQVWRTWETDPVLIPLARWHDYAGGWGEVGEFKFTTGPLGPRFKRNIDRVPIRIIKGRPHVVLRR